MKFVTLAAQWRSPPLYLPIPIPASICQILLLLLYVLVSQAELAVPIVGQCRVWIFVFHLLVYLLALQLPKEQRTQAGPIYTYAICLNSTWPRTRRVLSCVELDGGRGWTATVVSLFCYTNKLISDRTLEIFSTIQQMLLIEICVQVLQGAKHGGVIVVVKSFNISTSRSNYANSNYRIVAMYHITMIFVNNYAHQTTTFENEYTKCSHMNKNNYTLNELKCLKGVWLFCANLCNRQRETSPNP